MSSQYPAIPKTTAALLRDAPYVGALLRVANQMTRQRSIHVLVERGFTDLNPALLSAFNFPPPEGVRPIDLAERINTTKQAMNYLLSQLESLGYMERRAEKKGGRRLVYLTRRGWLVFDAIWTAQRQLEDEWAKQLGRARFDEFMGTLRQLSVTGAKDVVEAPKSTRGRRSKAVRARRTSGRHMKF
jgi:DNA-binding MarR family transcriptional regulator